MESFDPDSGIVFRETIIRPRKRDTPWEYKCPAQKVNHVPPPQGAPSLYATALHKIEDNALALSPESLEPLPNTIAQRLRREIRRE